MPRVGQESRKSEIRAMAMTVMFACCGFVPISTCCRPGQLLLFTSQTYPRIPTMAAVALPENFQLQSPLVRLPLEIQHIIYGLCFTANVPFVDPIVNSKDSTKASTPLNVALLQTCRRTYFEADRRPLFAQNTFRFTTVGNARKFFHSIDGRCRSSIHDVEIDVQKFGSNHPDVAREWLQYLHQGAQSHAKTPRSLLADVPRLDTLRLNFTSWPKIPLFRPELWKVLKNMLGAAKGLKRVVVIGASKGSGMARRDPWSPTHFVGADDVSSAELIPHMLACVEGPDEAKIIRWTRQEGQLHLEVILKSHLLKHVDESWTGTSYRQSTTEPWPVDGSCTPEDYLHRDTSVENREDKELNPNGAE